MKFALDPELFRTASNSRLREWNQALAELNERLSQEDASTDGLDELVVTLHKREDDGVDFAICASPRAAPAIVRVSGRRLIPHFNEYRGVIGQLTSVVSGVAAVRQMEALDYAKKLVHDEAGETLQRALGDQVALEHDVARRLFTLVFLISSSVPEGLVRPHRQR